MPVRRFLHGPARSGSVVVVTLTQRSSAHSADGADDMTVFFEDILKRIYQEQEEFNRGADGTAEDVFPRGTSEPSSGRLMEPDLSSGRPDRMVLGRIVLGE